MASQNLPRQGSQQSLLGGIQQVPSAEIQPQLPSNPSPPTMIPEPRPLVTKISAVAAFILIILLALVSGLMIETTPYMKKDQKIINDHLDVHTVTLYLISLVGSVLGGWASDKYGRRPTIVLVGCLFFFGPLLMGLASNNFFVWLGRSTAHIGVGYALTTAPIYVAEISPSSSRGLFASLPEVAVNIGIVIGHLCNYFFTKLEFNGGFLILCVGSISLIPLVISILALPESPRWLVMKGRSEDARSILARITGSEEAATRLVDEIKEAAHIPSESSSNVVVPGQTMMNIWWQLLRPTASVLHMIICTLGIHLFQHACGLNIILLYNPRIFEKAGVSAVNWKLLLNIAVESVKLVFSIIGSLLVDRAGRRRSLLYSTTGMIVCLLSLASSLISIDRGLKTHSTWCLISLFFYVASYSIGMGPVTAVYSAELFPPHLRAQGSALSFTASQLSQAGVTFLFLLLSKTTTLGLSIFMFAAGAIIAWIFFFIFMPETGGFTLEQMVQRFGNFFWWRFRTAGLQQLPTLGLSEEDLERLE